MVSGLAEREDRIVRVPVDAQTAWIECQRAFLFRIFIGLPSGWMSASQDNRRLQFNQPMMLNYQNWIGGEWRPAVGGRTIQTRNPADAREIVATYSLGGREDALSAITAAQAAAPKWAAQTSVARGRILSKASQILESRKPDLAQLLTREEGKTLAESTGEVQRAVDIFRFFGGLSYLVGGQTIPHDLPNNLLYTTRQPLGVVALITPWNFPVAIPAWKLAPALVCGNAVVLKPASQAPALSLELARVLQEAGLPAGVFNVLVGSGTETGAALAEHPSVQAVSFTGCLLNRIQIPLKLGFTDRGPHVDAGCQTVAHLQGLRFF